MAAQDPDEPFDLYDREGAPLGQRKARRDVHRDGDWHKSIHVWVVLREEPRNGGAARSSSVLFQRRSPGKDTWPGALDVAVTGHLRAGEAPLDGLREAEEEVGLALDPSDVIRIGRRRRVDHSAPGIRDHELQEIFATITARPLATLAPDPDEVTALVAVDLEAVSALFRGDRAEVDALEMRGDTRAVAKTTVGAGDFVAALDGYYLASVRSLEAWLQGPAPSAWTIG